MIDRAMSWTPAVLLSLVLSAATAADIPAVVNTRPSLGRFVETKAGFMVPYELTIPGTDVTIEMEPIPGGSFTMGSPKSEAGRADDEGPQVQVVVEPFWMAKTEITWQQYKPYMKMYDVSKGFDTFQMRKVTAENKADAVTAPTPLYDSTHTFHYGERPRQAAVTMTQYAAKQYTKWLSLQTGQTFRLPTEAEWEYACRAGSTTAYHFGDDADQLGEYAWFKGVIGDTGGQRDVAGKKPNRWGLHDMHGNVWEWTLDAYSQDGFKRFAGKKVSLWDAVSWPTKEFPRTVRGGSWEFGAERSRCAARMGSDDTEEGWKSEDPNSGLLSPWWYTSDPARGVGFRLVRQLGKPDVKLRTKIWDADVEKIDFDVKDRIDDGRGAQMLVDEKLPQAVQELEARRAEDDKQR